MNRVFLKELGEKYEKSQEVKDKVYFEYFKSISTLSVALIGLLIGLKATPIPNQPAKIAFLLSIILIGFCIVFSLATRFCEVIFHNQMIELRRNQLIKYMENPSENDMITDNTEGTKFFKLFEISTFSCLILSIISLIFYVYFLEFF